MKPRLPAAVCSLNRKSSGALQHQLQRSPKTGATTGPLSWGTLAMSSRKCTHPSQYPTPSHMIDVYKRQCSGLLPPRTITQFEYLTLKPVIVSDEPQPRESDDGTPRSCPRGIIAAEQSAAKPRPRSTSGSSVLINILNSRSSRSVQTGWIWIPFSLPRQNVHTSTKGWNNLLL